MQYERPQQLEFYVLEVGKEDGETNLVDLLTKVLNGEKRWKICWHIMW
jgi:hypothetical protein